ncbi:hypothetical protein LHJ74_14480 [Streptomyces sp. N2-109]|uniref:HNH endonuclease n=1 Tax=Streptomyces gossypii TaxID=2883101 RepID=A0ABT2JUR8_9ACTN|nr:hypothetical protein [Streptomyces gossypii]MCT2591100.1 hypothetical protein [Streptomyces gossypii]
MKQNATKDEIAALLREGLSNNIIAAQLRCDRARVSRIRRDLGIPNVRPQPLTLEQVWATHTRPVRGGHLEWLGERQSQSGTPTMRYREQPFTAARIAFRIRTGRDPLGYARAECGIPHCVAPEHMDDTAARLRTREQLRYLTGGQERPAQCRHGHDQDAHGRYGPDGTAYCQACNREQKRKARVQPTGGTS